jgi:hypothetical protein
MYAELYPSNQVDGNLFVFALALVIQIPYLYVIELSIPLLSSTNTILVCNLVQYSTVHGYGRKCEVFVEQYQDLCCL